MKPETLAAVLNYSIEKTICRISHEDSFLPQQVLLCRCQRLGLLLHHPNASCSQPFYPAIQHLLYLYKLHIPLVRNSKLWACIQIPSSVTASLLQFGTVYRVGRECHPACSLPCNIKHDMWLFRSSMLSVSIHTASRLCSHNEFHTVRHQFMVFRVFFGIHCSITV